MKISGESTNTESYSHTRIHTQTHTHDCALKGTYIHKYGHVHRETQGIYTDSYIHAHMYTNMNAQTWTHM